MKVLQKNYKTIIAFLIGIIVSASTAYLTTTKALTANGYAVDSSNVEYKDSTNNTITNVQAAINGTCTKFNEQLNELRESMYPVGSIYLSTSLSTTSAVATALGGTWEVYGSGRTLIGSDGTSYKAGTTGGATSVSTTLTTSNLPAHTHTVTAKGSVSSTFTGSSVTSSSSGNHGHSITAYTNQSGYNITIPANKHFFIYGTGVSWTGSSALTNQNAINAISTVAAGNHTHTVTAAGTVSSTFTGSSATTSSTGSGTAFTTSTMQPYIVVYMYRRIS